MLTLVLGGARSGKSAWAEALIRRELPPWTYLATAETWDDEMRARVAAHRAARAEGWRTVEVPIDLPDALYRHRGPVLVDCLTLWVSNLLCAGREVPVDALLAALEQRGETTVLVSNEVGLGIVPDNALARRFRDEAGRLHQRVAEAAGRVVLTVAGLPLAVKGAL